MAKRIWAWVRFVLCLPPSSSRSDEGLINEAVSRPIRWMRGLFKTKMGKADDGIGDMEENKENIYETHGAYQLPSVSELRLWITIEKIRQQIGAIEPMNNRVECENYNEDETNNIKELLEDTKWNLLQQQEDLNEMRSDIQHLDYEWTNMVNTLAREWGSFVVEKHKMIWKTDRPVGDIPYDVFETFPLLNPIQDPEWEKKIKEARDTFTKAEEELRELTFEEPKQIKDRIESMFETESMVKNVLVPMVEMKRSLIDAEKELEKKMDICKDAEERVDLVRYLFNNPDQTSYPTRREVVENKENEITVTLHRGEEFGFDSHAPPEDGDTKNEEMDKQHHEEEPGFHTPPEDIEQPLSQTQVEKNV